MKKFLSLFIVLSMILSLSFGTAAVLADEPAENDASVPAAEEQYEDPAVSDAADENTADDAKGEVSGTPGQEEPVTEEPAAEEPVPEEPAPENPVPEEPAEEGTAAQDPASEEPASEKPAPEEPAPEGSAPEEPETDRQEQENSGKTEEPAAAKKGSLKDGEASTVTITEQPKDATVSYPDPVSFHVGVSDPGNVSYQWHVIDSAGHDFVMEGVSAKTDTLKLVSTSQDMIELSFYCVVTDKAGKSAASEKASLTIANQKENKTVLYVSEYAIEAGDPALDLSTTKLGKGKITFDKNGKDITFDNVEMSTGWMSASSVIASAIGIALVRDGNTQEQYNINLKGKNVIKNNHYEEDYNAGGITLDFGFISNETEPLFVIQGEGSLKLEGGSNALMAGGDLQIDAEVNISPKNYFNDGIQAENILVSKGTKLDLDVLGTGIFARGNLVMEEGSEVKIKTRAPYVKGDFTTKNAILAGGAFKMTGADLKIDAQGDPDYIVKFDSSIASFGGIAIWDEGSLQAKDSKIAISMSAKDADKAYAYYFSGIVGREKSNISLDSTELDIKIDSKNIYSATGLYTGGSLTIDKSKVSVEVKANDRIQGIAPEGALTVTDSDVTVNAEELNGAECYGILCGSAEISLSGDHKIRSTAKKGIAFAANTDKHGDEKKGYESGYTSKKISLKNSTVCVLPEKNEISLASMEGSIHRWMYVETFYNSADTSKPAAEVEIAHSSASEAVYKFDSSSDSVWVKGSSEGLKATVTRKPGNAEAFAHFQGIEIDGKTVNKKNYTAESGSVKLTVGASYLETLSLGKHTLKMLFDDGSAETEISVKEQIVINVRGNSSEVVYSGTSQKAAGVRVSSESKNFDVSKMAFAEGRSAKAEGTDVGTYQMGLTGDFFVYNDENVDAVINITQDGTLTITAAPLTVRTGSANKVYDGKPLTNAEASLSGLVNGETASVAATGSQTQVGTSANTYTITWNTAKESNYKITETLGTLTVKSSGSNGGGGNNNNSSSGGKSNTSSNVKTGDENSMSLWIVLIAAAGAAAALAGIARKRRVR